jgi:hypothetical protein
MLDILAAVEEALPDLLADEASWKSLYIDYHPPTVERLWRHWGEYRVSLHRIHPCPPGAALFHPHPWPSAMRILDGEYEMAVGYGKGMQEPPVAALMIARGDFRYTMTDPDAWHYVRPIDRPSMSLMVTGKPWDREAHPVHKELIALGEEQKREILAFFRKQYAHSQGARA